MRHAALHLAHGRHLSQAVAERPLGQDQRTRAAKHRTNPKAAGFLAFFDLGAAKNPDSLWSSPGFDA
jgi:hypothetical protein